MDLANQEFKYNGSLDLDEGAITLESPLIEIIEFTYNIQARQMSGQVRFYDQENTYSLVRTLSVEYDGGQTFENIILALTLGYDENVATV